LSSSSKIGSLILEGSRAAKHKPHVTNGAVMLSESETSLSIFPWWIRPNLIRDSSLRSE